MEVLRAFARKAWGLWVKLYWHPPNDLEKLKLSCVIMECVPDTPGWKKKMPYGFKVQRDSTVYETIEALRYYHPELTCLDEIPAIPEPK